jgi:hypothetical protein
MALDAAEEHRIITEINAELLKSLLSNRNLIPAQCDFNAFYCGLTPIYSIKHQKHSNVLNQGCGDYENNRGLPPVPSVT